MFVYDKLKNFMRRSSRLSNRLSNTPEFLKARIKCINFKIKKKLGEGNFSTVKLATHSLTEENVAIKILDKTRIAKHEDKERINRELRILKQIHHNNTVKLFSVIESKCSIYIVQELLEGRELLEYINSKGRLSEIESCKIFQQIISGLEYLHNCGIAHRDLKPENIIVLNNKIIKLLDFGLSNFFKKNQLLSTACGSPCYVPPEMILEKKYNGAESDIWSAGIILYLMLVGNLPFNDENNQVLYRKILSGKYEVPYHLSPGAKDILSKMIEINPNKRITIEEIKNHSWFNLVDKNKYMHKGIMVDTDIFPIDEEIISAMEKMGYDNLLEIRNDILCNYHNNITTTYYLLLNKKIKEGKKSIADLHSELYDEYINNEKNKISNFGNFENMLKNKIEPIAILDNLPKYIETKPEDNNEEMIIGDTGNVVERLVKAGKLVFDEENMCLNRPKKNTVFRKASDITGGEYKTISEMNTKTSENEKFKKINSINIYNTNTFDNKHNNNHNKYNTERNNKKNEKNEKNNLKKNKDNNILKSTRNKKNDDDDLQKNINTVYVQNFKTNVTLTEENNQKKAVNKRIKNEKHEKKNNNNLRNSFMVLDTSKENNETKKKNRTGSMELRNNNSIKKMITTDTIIKKMDGKETKSKNTLKSDKRIAKSFVNLKNQNEKPKKDLQKGKYRVINTETNNENDTNNKNIKGKYINDKFWNEKRKNNNNKKYPLNRKDTGDIDKSFEIRNAKTKLNTTKDFDDTKKMRKNKSLSKRIAAKI